jgi:hypothetical protein
MTKPVNNPWKLPPPEAPVRRPPSRVVRYVALWVGITSTLLVLTLAHPPASLIENTGGSSASVSCTNTPSHDTAALLAAIKSTPGGGTVHIAAGKCALSANLPVHDAMTIDGAGPLTTFLVQHARANIFQITAPGVTVENVNLDTVTYNRGPGSPGHPEPAVLFSAQSHTTIRNVTAEAGSGYGMRITGPSPCDSYQTSGTIVDTLTITNSGTGGFAALDIDCTNGAQLRNIVIHGDYLALYQDENVSLANETYTPDAKPCQAPWYISGPSHNISIAQVHSSGGHGIIKGPSNQIVITGVTSRAHC